MSYKMLYVILSYHRMKTKTTIDLQNLCRWEPLKKERKRKGERGDRERERGRENHDTKSLPKVKS